MQEVKLKLGVGTWSSGKYKSKVGRQTTKEYQLWSNMLLRAYSEKYHIRRPTYKDVEVCSDWHNADNFLDWCQDQVGYGVEGFQLEKDILKRGNKLYCPEFCMFVPCEINNQFVKHDSKRGDFPLGVRLHKGHGTFEARLTVLGGSVFVGSFDCPTKAFYAYKQAKEDHIKKLAEKYKDSISSQCYAALYNYKVEITD